MIYVFFFLYTIILSNIIMTKTVIIIILVLLILIFNCLIYKDSVLNSQTENFVIFNNDEKTPSNFLSILFPSNKHTTSIYENRFNFIPSTINKDISSSINNDDLKSNKCCLVKKELNNNNFKYTYTAYNNLDCDINNFALDHNNELLTDGINHWNNNECKNDTNILGSCQHYNFECIDFVDKETCNKYNEQMPPDPLNRKITFNWSNKPCYNR